MIQIASKDIDMLTDCLLSMSVLAKTMVSKLLTIKSEGGIENVRDKETSRATNR